MNLLLSVLACVVACHVGITWFRAVRHGHLARRRGRTAPVPPCSLPSVSIIIPAWREVGTLTGCLRSLQTLQYPVWDVILVAGGDDGTYPLAVRLASVLPRVTVLEQGPHGKNAALTQGLGMATGEVIVLLDADSIVTPDWLTILITPLTGTVGATTGTPQPLRLTPMSRAEQLQMWVARRIHGSTTLHGSGSIALRRDAIAAIGGFPETVRVGVDWDLDARLARRGIGKQVCEATVYTERAATLSEVWANEVRWRRAHLLWWLHELTRTRYVSLATWLHGYIYALSWIVLGGTVLLTLLGFTDSTTGYVDLLLLCLWWGWLTGRRTALVGAATAHSHEARWLEGLWTLPLLLVITFAASALATVTLRQPQLHFKGPRPAVLPSSSTAP